MPADATTVLALNLGSATLKAAHYHARRDGNGAALVAHGKRLNLAIDGGNADMDRLVAQVAALVPADALPAGLIAHRIVHGGSRIAPLPLTDAALAELAGFSALAPLHQPAALALARAARRRWPDAPQVAVFDTAWHAALRPWSRRLPVSQALHDAGVVRYGFHGLAFQSAMRQLIARDAAAATQRVVLAHLGSGCSLCAVAQGCSIDTTMGMTPLDGLPMGTRSGALDPGAVLFMARHLRLSNDAIERVLWHDSGLLGVSGRSSDMRQLLEATDTRSMLAIDQFVMRVAQGIAGMATSLGGMDALVFSGGIGAHAPLIRQRIVDLLGWAGLRIDPQLNSGGDARIDADADGSRASIWRLEVDEEWELAWAASQSVSAGG